MDENTNNLVTVGQLQKLGLRTVDAVNKVAGAAADAIEVIIKNLPSIRFVVLLASDWTETSPYFQTISVPGVKNDINQVVSVSPASPDLYSIWGDCGLLCIEQAQDSLKFSARKKPEIDIPVCVILQGGILEDDT